MIAKGLGVVFFAIVARFLGARELGLYAFSLSVATFVALPSQVRFRNHNPKGSGTGPEQYSPILLGHHFHKSAYCRYIMGYFASGLVVVPQE